jgi:hypothetical protein|tara:strand:- start:2396 stop:2539 length:144 start_codon:yes stop_codon:yes gene_type:complete
VKELDINKGVELLLRGDKPKPKPKPSFEVKFGLFNREFHFLLDIKKK